MPAHLSGSSEAALHLERFGNYLGIAYQISDDIHDMTDSIEALGKDVRKDEHRGSIPYLHGVDKAIEIKNFYMGECIRELKASGGDVRDIVVMVESICV